jgi:hypothetical protein
MRIRLDKIASSARNANLTPWVIVGGDIPARAGVVVAVRVLDEKSVYNQVEDMNGRMMTIHRGDVLAGVIGERKALRGYSGRVPSQIEQGSILHLLNLGGLIGECTSANPEVGPPARVEVLGAVQHFPHLGRRVGQAASIFPGPISISSVLHALPPMALVVGSCMHAGKTRAACSLIRQASSQGLRVGVAKITGVALRRDVLEMQDHGAVWGCSFADVGLPSTCGGGILETVRGCLNAVAEQNVDLMVVELGDGLMGEYGVKEVLGCAEIAAAAGAIVYAANDPVAAWGGTLLLQELNVQATVITGPATDNEAGCDAIRERVSLPVANARSQPELLAAHVLGALGFTAKDDGGIVVGAA